MKNVAQHLMKNFRLQHSTALPCCPKIAFVGDSFCAEFYPEGSCPLIKTSEKTHPQIPHSNHFDEQQSNEFFHYLCRIIDNELFQPGIKQMDFCCVDDDPCKTFDNAE